MRAVCLFVFSSLCIAIAFSGELFAMDPVSGFHTAQEVEAGISKSLGKVEKQIMVLESPNAEKPVMRGVWMRASPNEIHNQMMPMFRHEINGLEIERKSFLAVPRAPQSIKPDWNALDALHKIALRNFESKRYKNGEMVDMNFINENYYAIKHYEAKRQIYGLGIEERYGRQKTLLSGSIFWEVDTRPNKATLILDLGRVRFIEEAVRSPVEVKTDHILAGVKMSLESFSDKAKIEFLKKNPEAAFQFRFAIPESFSKVISENSHLFPWGQFNRIARLLKYSFKHPLPPLR